MSDHYILNTIPDANRDEATVPQSQPLPGMVPNHAGGFTYAIPDLARLRRFLILGSEGGTFYQSQQELTVENIHCLGRLLDAGNLDAVRLIGEVSNRGLAPKNDPAIACLAIALQHARRDVREEAARQLSCVIRIGTHLYLLMAFLKRLGGPKSFARRAIGQFMAGWTARGFEVNTVKYFQRHGWTMAQVLDVIHPVSHDPSWNAVAWWANFRDKGWNEQVANGANDPRYLPRDVEIRVGPKHGAHTIHTIDMLEDLPLIAAYEAAHWAQSEREIINLIRDYGLMWEAVPTQWLGSARVWEALLYSGMKPGAMLRNLARMTTNGLLTANSEHLLHIEMALTDPVQIRQARLHPMAFLVALRTYMAGRGARGQNTWTPVARLGEILERGFYLGFDAVQPTGVKRLLAVDVSGSMNSYLPDFPGLAPRDVAACLMMVLRRTEPEAAIVAFSDGGRSGSATMWRSGQSMVTPMEIREGATLGQVIHQMAALDFGGTDCALPVRYAAENQMQVDSFEIITDNETWAGSTHPATALRSYREQYGIPARMTAIGVTATECSIADPNDPGMLDIAGFSADLPNIVALFAKGDL